MCSNQILYVYHSLWKAHCYITAVFSHHQTFISHLQMSYACANQTVVCFPIGSKGRKRSKGAHRKARRKGELTMTHTQTHTQCHKERHMHIQLQSHKHTPAHLIKYGWMCRPSWNWLLLYSSRWQAIWCSEKLLSGRGCLSLHSHPQRPSWES